MMSLPSQPDSLPAVGLGVGSISGVGRSTLTFERAFLRAAERVSQSPNRLRRQHLILTDSQVMLGVAQKGRSSVPQLNRFARRLAALTLGYRQCFFFRWVPTKLNPADEPSREFGDLLRGKPIGGRTGNKGTGLDASGVTPGSTRGPLRGLSP